MSWVCPVFIANELCFFQQSFSLFSLRLTALIIFDNPAVLVSFSGLIVDGRVDFVKFCLITISMELI